MPPSASLLLGFAAAALIPTVALSHPVKRTAASSPVTVTELSSSARRGMTVAQARCAGCHGVTRGTGSPNPESPPFEEIVNKRGLTAATLRTFLRDSHNYPAAMNFNIDRGVIGDLAAYMLTLKSRNYRPRI